MDQHQITIMNRKLDQTVKHLQDHRFAVSVLDTKEAVWPFLKERIPAQASVSVGGSMTLFECGIIEALRQAPVRFLDRYAEGADTSRIFHEAFNADVYLASCNALSEQGELLFTDGTGNRTAALIYGPKQVYVIIGYNKLVKDVEAGRERIRETAAPMNCERLNRDTPCRIIGSCADCHRPERICSVQVILERSHTPERIHDVIVKEDLGY